jgi:guanine deaminase
VAARGARAVHCPDSNFFLGSGRMRVGMALARGVPVALGTDVAAGRSFSVRRAMASAYDSALCAEQRMSPEALFTMATLGGARALGLDSVVGSLEVGKEADVAVFALPPYVRTAQEVLAHLVFANDVVLAERVLVRGRKLRAAPPPAPRSPARPPPSRSSA